MPVREMYYCEACRFLLTVEESLLHESDHVLKRVSVRPLNEVLKERLDWIPDELGGSWVF